MTAILKRCSNCKSTKLLETYFGKNKKGLYYKTCDTCRKNRKKNTIEQCQAFAEAKGGKCLSTEYKTNRDKMNWKCSEDHIWTAEYNDIKNKGRWCAVCSGNAKHTIEECKQFAESKGGLCLSETYVNAHTKMNWKCSEDHIWDSNFGHIKNSSSWCPKCSGNSKHIIEDCRQFAESKGGLCLSETYVNAHEVLLWQCSKNHIWNAVFNNIKNNGTWCATCSSHKSEKLCRAIFEELLSEPFPTKRPTWLDGLELDGYNETLNIAFEYNGIQHYEFIKRFHNDDPEEFEKQKARDIKKYSICQKRGLRLIIIPYQYDYTTPDEMREFILSKLN